VRLNRKRLRGETDSEDAFRALNTLFNVLYTMLRLCAPFIPFLTESMYQRIKQYIGPDSEKTEFASIHYLLIPEVNEALIDLKTESLVGLMQNVIILGRVIRDRKTLPIRHPLKELVIIVEDYEDIGNSIVQVRPYIFEELNVKQIKLTKNKDEFGIEMKAKTNFPVLASKAKDKVKKLSGLIENMSDAQVTELRNKGKYNLDDYELVLEDVKILPKCNSAQFNKYEADFDENVIVLLDITPDQEMIEEGVLRDIVNRIQRLRKELKIVPSDDITVYYRVPAAESQLQKLLTKSHDYMESNIKKPFKPLEASLNLANGKSFDVNKNLNFLII
jgi:isoleucyl-tRNA synthetase